MRVCPYSFYLALCLLAAGLWPAPAGAAQDLQGVFADLRDDIQSAQRALAAEQYQIELSMAALAKKIDIEGAGLRDLRQRVEVVRRTADESALSLETLQGRLQEWRAQDAYHRNLLRDFAERQGVAIGSSGHHGAVASALARLEQSLQPAFGPATVSRPSGELVTAQQLRLGPIRWYRLGSESGLLVQTADAVPKTALVFEDEADADLRGVERGEAGRLVFDPTVDRLLVSRVGDQTLIDHLRAGGLWVIPILGFALLALAIGLGKAVQFARLPNLQPVLSGSAEGVDWAEHLAPPQQAMLAAVSAATSAEDRDERLYQFLVMEKQRVERFLGAVAVTATVAPLLGLLGTVSGMITTFGMMTIFGAGDPAIVSGGISEALVTTEMGLVVAIPALIIHALLARKSGAYLQQLEATAIALTSPALTVTAASGGGRG